jgi:hypothetical protein
MLCLASSARTSFWTLQLSPSDAYAFYTLDYGDGSTVSAQYISGAVSQFPVYVYKTGGIFQPKLNVFNKISSQSINFNVNNFK